MRIYSMITALCVCGACVHASVVMETVPVGNPGNPMDTRYPDTQYGVPGFGAVDYPYSIGKYEVTNAQYIEFLNSVAQTDTYGLFTIVGPPDPEGIERIGNPGSYVYRLRNNDPAYLNRTVAWVSFWSACRFANWMHNGQPEGQQGPGTTETGSYTLDGYTGAYGSWIVRNPEATWVIPSEDEWYKAAYHKNDGVTGNYFDYPMSSDDVPSNDLVDPDPGNNGNFPDGDFTVGEPYWLTEVGKFENSESPYGTFDQGGNLWEWNETLVCEGTPDRRGVRGGSFGFSDGASRSGLHASYRLDSIPQMADLNDGCIGFRLAYVPEPSTLLLLVLGGVTIMRNKSH